VLISELAKEGVVSSVFLKLNLHLAVRLVLLRYHSQLLGQIGSKSATGRAEALCANALEMLVAVEAHF